MGVGINLQPKAVRELFDLGFTAEDLDSFGVPAKEWALVGIRGQEIYSEPRGTLAEYHWPQYAVHRGEFHIALYRRFLDSDSVQPGCTVTSYEVNREPPINRAAPCQRKIPPIPKAINLLK